MTELAADGVRVAVTCRVLKLARQPYYRWLTNAITDAEIIAVYRADALFDAHHDDPEFGYRFSTRPATRVRSWPSRPDGGSAATTAGGPRSANAAAGKDDTPARPSMTISCAGSSPRTHRTGSGSATSRSTKTGEGKLYLCAIEDVFSNRIVGYSISDQMKARLAVDTVNDAVARRGSVAGCVIHADRGSQFRARKMVRTVHHHGMVRSMGRVGAAGDNAAMESFFSLLQKSVLKRRSWETRDQLRIAIGAWIGRTCHRRRRQKRLHGLTLIEYEAITNTDVALAA